MKNNNKTSIAIVDKYHYENLLFKEGYTHIAGVDEVGRGPLAGPVVACAVILPRDYKNEDLNDSKKLSAKKREELYDIILRDALDVGIGIVSHQVVDQINIYQASKVAMCKALENLKNVPDHVLIDAVPLYDKYPKSTPLIKGDTLSSSIMAASIVAKVTRDRIMDEMAVKYPNYGFEKHKGYPTKYHLEMLEKYGPCPIHRMTYKPLNKNNYMQLSLDLGLDEE
jgi:ribonuclease HII